MERASGWGTPVRILTDSLEERSLARTRGRMDRNVPWTKRTGDAYSPGVVATRKAAYPPGERRRRVLWRTVTIGLYALLGAAAWWLSEAMGWNEKYALAAVAIPYWLVVAQIWRIWGPDMPGLHRGRRRADI